MNLLLNIKPTDSPLPLLVGVFLMLLSLPVMAATNSCAWETLGDWIAAYGKAEPQQTPQIAQTFEIFDRVQAVTDKSKKRLPKLTVIKAPKGKLGAMALPHEDVVISTAAIDMLTSATASRPVSAEEIKARQAFVLGHELAHLENEDFMRMDLWQLIKDDCPNYSERWELELAADRKGFTYAAMAGYRVALLLKAQPDFLTDWVQQVSPGQLQSELLANRVKALRQQLESLQEHLSYFNFGMRLSHFERCDDGLALLEDYQQQFPAREVLNNISFCYLQQARQKMEIQRSELYWLPMVLDTETLAGAFVMAAKDWKSLKDAAKTREAEGILKRAEYFLKQAVESDATYLPARLNLATTELYLGRPEIAQNLLKQAEQLAPGNLQIQGLKAIALYEQSEAGLDLWETAVSRLLELAKQPNAPLAIGYNLASLYEVRPRAAEAVEYWKKLLTQFDTLPVPIRAMTCRKLLTHDLQFPQCDTLESRSMATDYPKVDWAVPFESKPLSQQPAMQQLLDSRQWQIIPLKLSRAAESTLLQGNIYQSPDGQQEVLALNDYLQMQVVKGDLGTVTDFANNCHHPLRRRQVPIGALWSCEVWALLERDGRVTEIWGMLR